jgi:molecular chaperone DnaK (HSP70)
VVSIEGDVTEVLASHGNNRLGGDDFDDLLAEMLGREFQKQHGIDLRQGHPAARARLWWAAEEAKKKLSQEPFVMVREEALMTHAGKPLHLEMEVSRDAYEDMIRPLVDTTLDSVSKALQDSGKGPRDIDAVLLVGGSTRTPLVSRLLTERMGTEPRQDVHPDLCVALGAGVLASRLSGRDVDRVLVDISPYSFGVAYVGERGGAEYPHCYMPIVKRNTPLPLTRTESFITGFPNQTIIDIRVYQGEDEDALRNVLVGDFRIEGLQSKEGPNDVLCRMRLDLDGILEVTAIEKETGKSKRITIANAMQARTPEEIAAGRKRIQELFEARPASGDDPPEEDWEEGRTIEVEAERQEDSPLAGEAEAAGLMERSRNLLDGMHPEDREEAIDLHERISEAIEDRDAAALAGASKELRELLFFIEGKTS